MIRYSLKLLPFAILSLFMLSCAEGQSTSEKDLITDQGQDNAAELDLADISEEDLESDEGEDIAEDTEQDSPDDNDLHEDDSLDIADAEDFNDVTDAIDIEDSTDTVDIADTEDAIEVEDTVEEIDLPPPTSPLGRACMANASCYPGLPAWPSCLNAQCDGESCWYTWDGTGFCTHSCAGPTDCAVVDESPSVGSDFQCVQGSGDGLCMPGSNSACTSNDDCSSAEVCRLGFVADGGALVSSGVCQTAFQGGADIGQACNDDPIYGGSMATCANNMCLGNRCGGFCDNDADCGSSQLECVNIQIYSEPDFFADVCLGIECQSDDECTAPGSYCAPPLLFSGPPEYIAGRCQFTSFDTSKLALGVTCYDDEECKSDWCNKSPGATSSDPGQCSVLCNDVLDCAGNQLCAGELYGLPSSDDTQLLNVCTPAPGSKTVCTGQPSCSGDEVCQIFIVGQPSASDPLQFSGYAHTACVEPEVVGGAAPGESCGGSVECANGLCLTIDGGSSYFCSAPCGTTTDCSPYDMACASPGLSLFDQNDTDEGNDITVQVCIPN